MPQPRDKLLQLDDRISSSRISAMRVEPRMMGFLTAALLLIGLAGWLYLYQVSTVAGYSLEIRELQERKSELRGDITDLQSELAALDSLSQAMAWGIERGYALPSMSEPGRHVYVSVSPAELTTDIMPVDSEPPDLITADWGDRILEQLDLWITTPAQSDRS